MPWSGWQSSAGGWYGPKASGDAAQTTAFLARANAITTLDGTHTAAYKALINGLVADGNFALLDALYVLATQSVGVAVLNLVNSSYALTNHGASFIVDQGYTGDGSTTYLDTGFIPSSASGQFSLNSASIGAFDMLTRSAYNGAILFGMSDGFGNGSTLYANYDGGGAGSFAINDNSNLNFSSGSGSKAAYTISRTSASARAIYLNGNSTATASDTQAAQTSLSQVSIWALGRNNNGSLNSPSNDQIGVFYLGGGLTGAQSAAINNRINTFLASLATPVNVY